jgi:hypothetical protein
MIPTRSGKNGYRYSKAALLRKRQKSSTQGKKPRNVFWFIHKRTFPDRIRSLTRGVPKDKTFLILLLFVLNIMVFMPYLPTKLKAASADSGSGIVFSDSINITNTQSSATASPFQQEINITTLGLLGVSTILRSDLGNIRFCSDENCTTMLDAWLESCLPSCNQNATDILVWLKLPSGISADSSVTTYFTIFNASTTFESPYWGEAPYIGNPILVQESIGSGGAVTGSSTTLPNSVQAGDILVVAAECVQYAGSCGTFAVNTPTDSEDDTFTPITTAAAETSQSIQTWYAIANGGSTTVYIYLSGSADYLNVIAVELAGVSTESSSVTGAESSGSCGCTLGTSLTLQNGVSLEFAVTSGGYPFTYPSGFLSDPSVLSSYGAAYSLTATGSTTLSTSNSGSGSSGFAEVGISFPASRGTYGEFDNGQSVFTRYDNFAGDSLNSSWILNGVTAAVDNGVTITPTQQSASFSTNSITWNVNEYAQDVVGEAYATMQEGIGVGFQISNSTSGSTSTNQNLNTFDTTDSLSYICYIYQNPSGYSGMNDPCYSSPSWTAGNYYVESTARAGNGSGQIMLNYNQIGSTESDYGPSALYFQIGDWLSGVAVSAYWVRLRSEPPNNVMPSAVVSDPIPQILNTITYTSSDGSGSNSSPLSSLSNATNPSSGSGFTTSASCGSSSLPWGSDPYCLWVANGTIDGQRYVSLLFVDNVSLCCDSSTVLDYPNGNISISMTLQISGTDANVTAMSVNFIPASGNAVNVGDTFIENYGEELFYSLEDLSYNVGQMSSFYVYQDNTTLRALGQSDLMAQYALTDLVNILYDSVSCNDGCATYGLANLNVPSLQVMVINWQRAAQCAVSLAPLGVDVAWVVIVPPAGVADIIFTAVASSRDIFIIGYACFGYGFTYAEG